MRGNPSHAVARLSPSGRVPAILAACVLMAACAGPQASATPSLAEASSAASSGPSESAILPTVAPTENPGVQNFIAWILDLAPGSPAGPPEFVAYRALMDVGGGGCVRLAEGLQPGGEIALQNETARLLYGGVADACLAAFHGRAELWDEAAARFAALPTPTSCMDVAAHRLYGDLIRAHAENPTGGFVPLADPSQAHEPPCPTLTALTPDRGPRGTPVRGTGFNLDHIFELRVFYEDEDGSVFDRRVDYVIDGDALLFTMEDDTNIAVWACVVPQGAENWNGSGKLFMLEPAPAASGAATPTAPPAPTAPCPPPSTE